MRRCPRCQRASRGRPARPRGFLERRLLPALGLRPYRCPQCGDRSLRGIWSRSPTDADTGPVVALEAGRNGTPPTAEELDFEELVRRIGRAELVAERSDEA